MSLWQRDDAMLFELDGVITRTATVHAAAWKRVFDEFLAARSRDEGEPFEWFDVDTDFVRYIDGRARTTAWLPSSSPGASAAARTSGRPARRADLLRTRQP